MCGFLCTYSCVASYMSVKHSLMKVGITAKLLLYCKHTNFIRGVVFDVFSAACQ